MKKLFFLLTLLLAAPQSLPANAFSTTKLTRSVALNSKVIIQTYIIYDISPCRSKAAPAVDPRTPRLGKVSVSVIKQKRPNGPCDPDFIYEALQVVYQSGSEAGVDQFTLYVSDGYGFTPVPVEIRVGVGVKPSATGSVAATTPNSVKPPRAVIKAATNFAGNYVNNFGNQIRVNNEFVYFTGVWSGVSVKNKPFTVMQNSNGRLVWASYICEGDSLSFVCTHQTTKEQRLYRLIH